MDAKGRLHPLPAGRTMQECFISGSAREWLSLNASLSLIYPEGNFIPAIVFHQCGNCLKLDSSDKSILESALASFPSDKLHLRRTPFTEGRHLA